MWIPNLKRLELDITYVCGFGCNNCNRMTVIAPGTEESNVTVSQIEKLIRESIELKWDWKYWNFLGGEPTTHPHFFEMIQMALNYQNEHNKELLIAVSTHGGTEAAKSQIEKLNRDFPSVKILNTKKTSIIQPRFDAINSAPIDRPKYAAGHEYIGCFIPERCGVGFNYAGFYCCAIAGAIDRVVGLKMAIRSLQDLKEADLVQQYKPFCSLCGHYDPIRNNSETVISPTWKKIFERFKL